MKEEILSAYEKAQKGDMSMAHDLYYAARFMPIEFWQEVDKCSEGIYRFFWDLFYPDNPI